MSAIRKQELACENQPLNQEASASEFNYHMLRYGLSLYKKYIGQLNLEEYQSVFKKARKSFELETAVITSSDAQGFVISNEQIEKSFDLLAARYDSDQELLQDLQANDLDKDSLLRALHRELLFDSVMQRVSENIPQVKEVDINLFYQMHRERFNTPEKRMTRHILVTVNPEFAENTPQIAWEKITDIADKLKGRSNRFKNFAKRFSECPTAIEGGKLGDVVKGQLYPELDAELFTMDENEISPVIETEMGFHLLLCEKIIPSRSIALPAVSEKIRSILEQRNRHNFQKNWLASLKASAICRSDIKKPH